MPLACRPFHLERGPKPGGQAQETSDCTDWLTLHVSGQLFTLGGWQTNSCRKNTQLRLHLPRNSYFLRFNAQDTTSRPREMSTEQCAKALSRME